MKSFVELDEFLKDEKNKEAFGGVIKNLGFYTKEDIENETTGLKNTNYNLKGEKLKLQKEYEEIKTKIDEIDFDEIKRLKEGKKPDKGSEEMETLKKQLKTFETKLKQKEDEETSLRSENEKMLKDVSLNEAITAKYGEKQDLYYEPAFKKILIDAYSHKAKIIEKDGKKVVHIDDESLGLLPSKEFFSKLITTDEGKKFAYVPKNTGANGRQFNGSSSGKKAISQTEFDSMSTPDQIAYSKEMKTGNASILP
jgi:hypothetical protein